VRCLFLFGRDLRLHDHAGLAAAARIGEVVPACVQSPASIAHLERSPRRAAFYRGALASLANDLAARGTRLTVRSGARVATTLRLVREAKADAVVWSASYDAAGVADDRALQSALEEAGVRATIVHDALAVPPDDTAAARSEDGGRGYRALAPYVTAWLALPRDPIATHVTFAAHDLATEEITEPASYGGQELASEMATLARCEDFISGAILQYPFARNVPGSGETSRLSAALSFGLISARTILARIDERARDPFLLAEERLALKTFVRSLARRDFFLQLAWFFEEHADDALQPRMRAFPFAKDHPAVAAWREGRTGYPLVDAGMRQLRATGWMHPRVRSIAASFLCFDLGVDWRVGRDAWDRELVEDEPALGSGSAGSVPTSRSSRASSIRSNRRARSIRVVRTCAPGSRNWPTFRTRNSLRTVACDRRRSSRSHSTNAHRIRHRSSITRRRRVTSSRATPRLWAGPELSGNGVFRGLALVEPVAHERHAHVVALEDAHAVHDGRYEPDRGEEREQRPGR
jgi:deoxyribodipyrimidine photo-lyase